MNPYLEMDLRTATPEALVGRLLDRAVSLVNSSIEKQDSSPVDSAEAAAKAVDIVSELRNALDAEAGGDVAENLDALYEFVNRRLVLGKIGGDPAALGEALRVLQTIAEGWSGLLEQRTGEP